MVILSYRRKQEQWIIMVVEMANVEHKVTLMLMKKNYEKN